MDDLRKSQQNGTRAYVEDTANELLRKGKKMAGGLYEEGLNKVSEAEDTVKKYSKEYSDDVISTIKENPVTSVLVAAGVGFLISMLLKK